MRTNDKDYELGHLIENWTLYYHPETLSVPSVKEVANSFNSNVERIESLTIFPQYLIGAAFRQERMQCEAELLAFNEIDTWITTEDKLFSPGRAERFAAAFEKIKEKYRNAANEEHGFGLSRAIGVEFINQILAIPEASRIAIGVEAYLASLVLGSWTAFEVLASDLWNTAVKECPNSISAEKAEKCAFASLRRIRQSYRLVFDETCASVLRPLDDSSLQHLAAVRNVLVHRAGKVDEQFQEQVTDHTTLKTLGIGASVSLTGRLVNQLVAPMMSRSVKLIEAVDAWIVSNRT